MTKIRQFSEFIYTKKLQYLDNIMTYSEAESFILRLNPKLNGDLK
jgi:hypothetical protein